MIGAIFFWNNHESVYLNAQQEKRIRQFFAYTLIPFGVNKMVVVDIDERKPIFTGFSDYIASKIVMKIEDALAEFAGCRFVFITATVPQGFLLQNLPEYKHPDENVVYVVGPDYGEINFGELKDKGLLGNVDFVKIPTSNSTVPLWSHTALGIAIYDRTAK